MAPTLPDAQPPKTSRRVARIVIAAVLIAAVLVFVFREPKLPEVVLLPSDTTIQSNPLPDRWIPRTWGWMWRLRDLVMGRRAPVNFDAITVRPLEPELAADLERLAVPALTTNGLRIWSMHAAKFDNAAALARKAAEDTIEPPGWVVFTPHRIKTADGIAATIFEGHKIPVVGGSFADVGFELQILARTHKRKTDVTFKARSTEMVAPPPLNDAAATIAFPSVRTNLLQAARVQVPIGNGLVLMQSPSGDNPGVVLLLSVGRK